MIIHKSLDTTTNNKHELFNENMIITSKSIYTTCEHNSGPLNSQRNSYTRFMIHHHDPGPRSMINASSTRSILFPYDPDPKNRYFDITTNDKHGLFNEHTITTPESIYTISEHDPGPLNSQ